MTGKLIDEVAQYLAANGLGTYTDAGNGTIFIGDLPDDDGVEDIVLAVFETTGLAPDIDIPLHQPGFQILLRDTAIAAGQVRAQAVRDALHNFYNGYFVANQTYIYACNLTAEGGHIGQDEKGRDLFSLNFLCRVR